MGGAKSHACQSGVHTVTKRLIPSIGRYAVIGCSLQVANSCIILYTHNSVLLVALQLQDLCKSCGTCCKFYHSCESLLL